ncbi:MAG: aldehyde dehydrogenase family protein, partial [Acidimicrobiales bacterium]
MERIGHFIGGEVVTGRSGRRGDVFDPATGERSCEVDFANVEEVDRAVASAHTAATSWGQT